MFDALKNLDLDTFPADMRAAVLAIREQVVTLSEHNASLTEANAALTTQNAELEALNARLEHFVKELNQVIYGARSEKLTEDERQLAFEDIEVAQSEAEDQSDAVVMTTPRKKRKPVQRNLGNLPEHLERIEQIIEPDSIICPCGCQVRLPKQTGGCGASLSPCTSDRGWAANRRHTGPCQRVQICGSLPAVPSIPDIRQIRPEH